MPKRTYYHATGIGSDTFEWVDDVDKATQTDKDSAEVTRKQFNDAELVEIAPKHLHQSRTWVISRATRSPQEKMEAVRKLEADLRRKALESGLPEPFVSWVMDMTAGTLMLDAPAASDTTAARPISWDSDRFVVIVFCPTRGTPVSALIDF